MPGNGRGYERVPQTEDNYSLHTVSTTYNYDSGIVIPSSPPPSFHSSADATCRQPTSRPSVTTSQSTSAIIQTPSSTSAATSLNPQQPHTHTTPNNPAPLYRAALTSNALASLSENNGPVSQYPPTIPDLLRQQDDDNRSWVGSTTDIGQNSLTTNLHRRLTRLEETIGRLLIVNDELRAEVGRLRDGGVDGDGLAAGGLAALGGRKATNCCVSFYDDESARLHGLRGRDNCCVSIGGDRNFQAERARGRQMKILGFLLVLVATVLMFLVVLIADRKADVGHTNGVYSGGGTRRSLR